MQNTSCQNKIKERLNESQELKAQNLEPQNLKQGFPLLHSLFILAILASDAFIFSCITPNLVLNGPTLQDSFSASLGSISIAVVLGTLTSFFLVKTKTFSRYFRLFASIALIAKIYLTVGLLFPSENILELIASSQFISACLIILLVSGTIENQINKLIASSLICAELSKILFLYGLTSLNYEHGYQTALIAGCSVYAMILLIVLASIFKTKKSTISPPAIWESSSSKDTAYNFALLTASLAFIYAPYQICFLLSSSCSIALVKAVVVLSIGVVTGSLAFCISSVSNALPKEKLHLLTIASLVFLTLSRSELVSNITVFLCGLSFGALVLTLLKKMPKIDDYRANKISILTGLILSFLIANGLLNRAQLIPSAYLFQTVALVFISIQLVLLFVLEKPRLYVFSVMANMALKSRNFRKAEKSVSSSSLKLSLLNSLKSQSHLYIVTKDGFLNLAITKTLLKVLNASVWSNKDLCLSSRSNNARRTLLYVSPNYIESDIAYNAEPVLEYRK